MSDYGVNREALADRGPEVAEMVEIFHNAQPGFTRKALALWLVEHDAAKDTEIARLTAERDGAREVRDQVVAAANEQLRTLREIDAMHPPMSISRKIKATLRAVREDEPTQKEQENQGDIRQEASADAECCASGRCEVCSPGYIWGES